MSQVVRDFTSCIDYIETHTQNYMLGNKDGEIKHTISNYIEMAHEGSFNVIIYTCKYKISATN
jgi:hypothetical protein